MESRIKDRVNRDKKEERRKNTVNIKEFL